MATYIIGDVHGCFDALMLLLEKIKYDSRHDQLGFVGDLINRGSQSLETLRFISSLEAAYVVLGNHDISALAQLAGVVPDLPQALQPLYQAPDKETLLHWLRHQPLLHYPIQDYALVHAGIPPQWSALEALEYSHDVERQLQSKHYDSFLKSMWSNEPHRWKDCTTDIERQRYTINALTRMRFCNQQGDLDLINKADKHHDPHFQPWFHWQTSNTPIIFGHWATLKGVCPHTHCHALDTGCVYGGELSAFRLEDKKRWTVTD